MVREIVGLFESYFWEVVRFFGYLLILWSCIVIFFVGSDGDCREGIVVVWVDGC